MIKRTATAEPLKTTIPGIFTPFLSSLHESLTKPTRPFPNLSID